MRSAPPGAVLAVSVALLLAGCSGDDRADRRTAPTTTMVTTPQSPPPPSSPGPTSPTVTGTPDPGLDQPLLDAARRGDAGQVRALLARGARVRARDMTRATPLVVAAYGNHLRVAQLLVAAGADVNAKDRSTQSAYLIATSEVGDDPRLLDLTLANGARVSSLDRFRGTGLIRAADRGNWRIVERLLRTPVDVDHVNRLGWTALHEAIILGNGGRRYVETVRRLVRGGADVNLPSRRDGIQPLTHATRRGCDEIADLLRAAGAR